MLSQLRTVAPRVMQTTRRTYATPGRKSYTDLFAKGWNSIVNRISKAEARAQSKPDPASPSPPAVQPAKATSAEAEMRRGSLAAQAAAKAKAAKKAKAALPPAVPASEVIAATLAEAGIQERNLAKIPLSDLSFKGKLIGNLVTKSRVQFTSAQLSKLTTVAQVQAAAAAPVTPVLRHPVAAWFLERQAKGSLPPNVKFVPYTKQTKMEIRKLY
ncbi:hypothetical protein H9P43_001144 [Blastocladiella emersonii ATCC 22665]|nr:hypothetical protein H9P43_001144 [Blastocladiella emersonii ATCC 22665]